MKAKNKRGRPSGSFTHSIEGLPCSCFVYKKYEVLKRKFEALQKEIESRTQGTGKKIIISLE